MFEGLDNSVSVIVTPATLERIEVQPISAEIPVGGIQQFEAIAFYSDGTSEDVTGQASWVSSDPAVSSVDEMGLATALGVGTSEISAHL